MRIFLKYIKKKFNFNKKILLIFHYFKSYPQKMPLAHVFHKILKKEFPSSGEHRFCHQFATPNMAIDQNLHLIMKTNSRATIHWNVDDER
jgi:hypothetical protein